MRMSAGIDFGLGLRPEHYEEIVAGPRRVSWFEALSENYMVPGGAPLHWLDCIRRDYPVALHGVSLSIGSVDPLNGRYLDDLAALVDRVQPMWISDHLCFTGLRGLNMHDLLPLPYTEEALNHVAERVQRVQDRLGRRLVLENVSSYVTYASSQTQRMGLYRRTQSARRLRDSARHQQRVCQRLQSRARRHDIPAWPAACARAPVPSRWPHAQGQPHHRHTRPSRSCPMCGRSTRRPRSSFRAYRP